MTSRVSNAMVRWAAGAFGSLALTSAMAGDVAVSVNVSVPGMYGQITLGGLPAPELILPQAVIAIPSLVVEAAPPEPLYLHVPPGHEKHWSKHCHEYNACGRPVYFVSDRWYNGVYVPHRDYREGEHERHEHYEEHDHGHGHEHGHEHGHDRDDDRR